MFLDIDQLRTFLAVVDNGSFTAASQIVHKTQSAVSMQMKKLEELLQKKLFVKDGRAIKLSSEGERLVFYARRAVSLNFETLAAFDDNALTGNLRFGLADDYAERYLPEILTKFSESNPLVEISVECMASSLLDNMISQNQLDIALVSSASVKNPCETIRREPMYWVTSANHDTHNKAILPLAVDAGACSWRQMALDSLSKMNRKHAVRYVSASALPISSAVLAGLAVALMPETTIRRGMRILTEKDGFASLPPVEIGIIHHPKMVNSTIGKALIDHIRSSLNNLMDEYRKLA